jgi:hypothetical protein
MQRRLETVRGLKGCRALMGKTELQELRAYKVIRVLLVPRE